jgi:hypothetical protein
MSYLQSLIRYFQPLTILWGDGRWVMLLLVLFIGFCAGMGVEQMLKGCP